MPPQSDTARWPELPYAAWKDTCETLHLWTQVIGKVRLALTPWLNHSWHVTLQVTARGLGTPPITHQGRAFTIEFDFIDHVLWLRTSDGHFRQLMLKPMTVAEFYADVMMALREIGIGVRINEMPNEIPGAVPFPDDRTHASYDRDFAQKFWRVLLSSHEVFSHFRTGFLGKVSPVHFFWGSFDLAVTRFSGRQRRRIRAACRTCRTPWRARPIRMRCRARVFGRAAARSIIRRSILMPIRRRRALPQRRFNRPRRSIRKSWANSSCRMTRRGRHAIRRRC